MSDEDLGPIRAGPMSGSGGGRGVDGQKFETLICAARHVHAVHHVTTDFHACPSQY